MRARAQVRGGRFAYQNVLIHSYRWRQRQAPRHSEEFSTLTSIKDRRGRWRDDALARSLPEHQEMPAEAIPFVAFICCVYAIAIGAFAYAQSTVPKDVAQR